MVTKGYGFTIDDIDWSCPADLEPYENAYKLQLRQQDSQLYTMGMYALSAVSVAIEHCFAGEKAKMEYIKKPFLQNAFEDEIEEGYKECREEIAVFEMKQRIKVLREKGLPESPI